MLRNGMIKMIFMSLLRSLKISGSLILQIFRPFGT